MYDIETGDIVVSRDVIFQENIFPFFESKEIETSEKILTDGANFLVEHNFKGIQNGLIKELWRNLVLSNRIILLGRKESN